MVRSISHENSTRRLSIANLHRRSRPLAWQTVVRSHRAKGQRTAYSRSHGATRPDGIRGHSRLHTAKILRLSEDLPIVIEIVDSKEKIDKLMPHIDEMVQEGLGHIGARAGNQISRQKP